jgi:hypothetical protein
MNRIFVPTQSALDWKRLLAREHHWKAGFSAMSVAQSWEAAGGELPSEIAVLFRHCAEPGIREAKLLLAIPEYQVDLPGGSRPTQTDVFALLGSTAGLVAVAVEGKVDETFGPTVAEKRREGAEQRIEYLHRLLELEASSSGTLRYQLLHRAAAAILLAQRFHARAAALVVHSFSPESRWFSDFEAFGMALGSHFQDGELTSVGIKGGVPFFAAWAAGDQRFRADLTVV